MKKIVLVLLLSMSGFVNAAEVLRLFPIYPSAIGNVVGDIGIDLPNTEFAINTIQINVFQPCGVLQYGGFTVVGGCGTYKPSAQLWKKVKSLILDPYAIPLAVLQYPTTQSTLAYSTLNGQPFIVGSINRYSQQSCDPALVDTTKYVTTSEPCIGGLQVWRRTSPVQ